MPSFSAWLNKGFHLRAHATQMSDARTDPEIAPSSIFLAVFYSFVFRLPSFQQLDNELAHSHLQHWIGAERAFGCRGRRKVGPEWQAEKGQQCGYAMAKDRRGRAGVGPVWIFRKNGFPAHWLDRRGTTFL